jgi:hypothetical protein
MCSGREVTGRTVVLPGLPAPGCRSAGRTVEQTSGKLASVWSFFTFAIWMLATLTRDIEEPADKSLPVAQGNDVATQPGVKVRHATGQLHGHWQGQYTIVIPPDDPANRKDRLAYPPNDDRVAVERLVRETIAALQ